MINILSEQTQDVVFDIETTSLESWNGRITAIGLKDTDGETIIMYDDEKQILQIFWDIVRTIKKPQLVSFNGKNFDVPFLICRSLKYGISVVDIRFNHIDLRRVLSPNHFSKGKLDDFASLLDMKKDGTGEQAILLWEQKNYEALKKYLLEDLRITWELFQRLKGIGWIK